MPEVFLFESTILTYLEYTVIMTRSFVFLAELKKVPIKIIRKRKRRASSTIMKFLSSAKAQQSNAVLKHKFGGARRRKTSYAADTF